MTASNGFYATKHHLATLDDAALLADLPALAPVVAHWRSQVVHDLAGDDGEAGLLAGQRVLLDAAVRTLVLLEVADRHILTRPSLLLVGGQGSRVVPLLDHRDKLVGRLERLLGRLYGTDRTGQLARRGPKLLDANQYLAQLAEQDQAAGQDGAEAPGESPEPVEPVG